MSILRTKEAVKAALFSARHKNQTIGFVPTMGALHKGHLALIKEAKLNSEIIIVSIFVNLTQFNNKADFVNYPKTLEKDLSLLENEGVTFVFVPQHEEVYSTPTGLILNFGELEKTLEGAYRPGHFNGVGIVVAKLLNIVKPDKIYLGQKDLQQVAVIKMLVHDLSFDVEIRVVHTIREVDGLAMSSRNLRLDQENRMVATIIYKCLVYAKEELLAGVDWFEVREKVTKRFHDEPLARLEYFELVETDTMVKVNSIESIKESSICAAAIIGEVRLIDNLTINN